MKPSFIRTRHAVIALIAILGALLAFATPSSAGVSAHPTECNVEDLTPTHEGDSGPNTIYGTPGDDIIFGYGGNDRLFGLGGNDIICGGPGNDRVDGGSGSDTLYGGDDVDRVYGRAGDDFMFGNDGNDYMAGANGNDEMHGQAGNDRMFGQNDDDAMFGGTGDDKLNGGRQTDIADGGTPDAGVTETNQCVDTETEINCGTVINGGNDAPVAADDNFSVLADETVIVTPLDGDTVPDANDTLSVDSIDTTATAGLVSPGVDANTFVYDPNGAFDGLEPDETATDSFEYTVGDGNGGTDTATVTITVTGAAPAGPNVDAVDDVLTVSADDVLVILEGEDLVVTVDGGDRVLLLANDLSLVPVEITGIAHGGTRINGGDGIDVLGIHATSVGGRVGQGILVETADYSSSFFVFNPDFTPGSFDDLAEGESDTVLFTYFVESAAGETDSALITVTVNGVNDDPVLQTLGTAFDVDENTTAVTDVSSSDIDGDADNGVGLTYSLGGADAILFEVDAVGAVSFIAAPDFEAPGDSDGDNEYLVTITVTDSAGATDSEDFLITVQDVNEAPAIMTRDVGGQLLDAQEFENDNTVPVVGATISFLGIATEVVTDANGMFTLPAVPVGIDVFEITGSTATAAANGRSYTDFHKALEVLAGAGVQDFGVFYTTQMSPDQFTVSITETVIVDAPELEALLPGSDAALEVVAGNAKKMSDGTPFTGELSISQVPNCCTPRTMPQFVLDVDPLIVTIQPLGVSFTVPAALSLPNSNGYAPATILNLWSLDPDLGVFVVVGQGQVSADGLTINTISGGIMQTDWHFFVPNPPVTGQPSWNFTVNSNNVVVPGSSPVAVDVRSWFTDPDGDPLTFSVSGSTGDVAGAAINPLTGLLSADALGEGGVGTIVITASDGALETTRTVTLRGTDQPIYTGPTGFFFEPGQPISIDFSELFTDPSGGLLTFGLEDPLEAPTDPSAMIDPVTGVFTMDTPPEFGFYDPIITATNALGTTEVYIGGGIQVNFIGV